MLSKSDYIKAVLRIGRLEGYTIEINRRNGFNQIDFGHKKLHTGHLADLYPAILRKDAHIPTLINNVAPGRPCSHKPMCEIIEFIKFENEKA